MTNTSKIFLGTGLGVAAGIIVILIMQKKWKRDQRESLIAEGLQAAENSSNQDVSGSIMSATSDYAELSGTEIAITVVAGIVAAVALGFILVKFGAFAAGAVASIVSMLGVILFAVMIMVVVYYLINEQDKRKLLYNIGLTAEGAASVDTAAGSPSAETRYAGNRLGSAAGFALEAARQTLSSIAGRDNLKKKTTIARTTPVAYKDAVPDSRLSKDAQAPKLATPSKYDKGIG